MEKYLDKNSVLRLLQGVKTQIDKSKTNILDTKGAANGIASLDENGNVPLSQLGNVDTVLFEIVHVLPTELTEQQKNHIFIVPRGLESESDKNTYKEYIYTGEDLGHIVPSYWEELGEFTSEVDLKPYSKKSETVTAIRFTSENSNGTSDSASPEQNLLIEFADGHHVVVDVPIAGADGYTSSGHGYVGNCGFMTNSDKAKLDKIDLSSLTASINAANTAAANTKKAIQAAETATAGAEKVDATLTEENVFEVTDRTGVKKTLDMSGLVSAQSDVARIQESMGIYSDRPNITLVAKETNKAISADGIKVTKAGWAIAEFTAELGNIYLFNPGETSSDVCVFAEYIDKVETRAIDYAYAYDESGRVLTAKATYNGKTYTYTYDYSTDETVITDQDNNKVSSLPSVFTTTVGAYNPMTILNTDAELPQDGYCRFVSNFTTASAIKIVVSYKVNSANLTMKVVRDGSTANMCSQLAKINKKVDDIAEKWVLKSKMLIHTCKNGCVVDIDNKSISLEARKSYIFENFRTFRFIKGQEAINKLCISNNISHRHQLFAKFKSLTSLTFINYKPKISNLHEVFIFCKLLKSIDVSGWDTSNVTNMNNMFANCSSLANITFGENFGKMQDAVGTLDLSKLLAWKNDSVKSLLTLYDRKANGMGVITLKLHANTKTVLGEDGIAQMTAKGYTIA